MTHRAFYLALTLTLISALLNLAQQLQSIQFLWPVIVRWPDPMAQQRTLLSVDGVPYDLLRASDALLPRNVTLLLVTDGRDVRHREYTTFHRTLYLLAPRAVWWVTPAPPDGTWESRWWISAPATAESLRAIVRERHATHVLVAGFSLPFELGQKIFESDEGTLFQLAEVASITSSGGRGSTQLFLDTLWPIQLSAALAVLWLLGDGLLMLIARAGYRAHPVERVALAWALTVGAMTLAMLWLNAAGLTLMQQIVAITVVAIIGVAWRWNFHARINVILRSRATKHLYGDALTNHVRRQLWRLQTSVHQRLFAKRRITAGSKVSSECSSLRDRLNQSRMMTILSFILLILQIAAVTVLAVGAPLRFWDSWVTWGMKARTIFLADRVAPSVYLDASRAVTHLDYPLLVPLGEAWLYGWLGAADDRLVGVLWVLFYLALLGIVYATLRRWGGTRVEALIATAVIASMSPITSAASGVMADLPLTVFSTIAVVYLSDWLEDARPTPLIIAALASGLLPWTKREGWMLLMALCIALLVVARNRRAWLGAGALALSAALLSGPWYVFSALNGVSNTDFLPITWATFQANLDRLPSIAWRELLSLISPGWNFVWIFLGAASILPLRSGWLSQRRASDLLPLTALIYLGSISLSYIFSSHVPYQQHVVSSLDRLIAHVAPLAALWLSRNLLTKAGSC